MSLRHLERALAEHDFVELDGRNKKHRIFRGPNAQTGDDVNVAVSHGKPSKDVPPGTLRQIARDMGLTLNELMGRN